MDTRWSIKYEKCRNCGETEQKHIARGLCIFCYQNLNNRENRGKENLSRKNLLTKEHLIEEYLNKNKSTVDIAKEYGCSRQNVLQQLNKHNIPTRNKSDARTMALDKGKIIFKRDEKEVVLQKNIYNENFFTSWTVSGFANMM